MEDFSSILINWYQQNKRNLPWRNTVNPYKIWLSEIILQQTRVDQGISYYFEFINAFPTVNDLANAEQDTVLKLWQGLGYYSRARNLHFTAKEIVSKHGSVFPNNYEEIIKLKGIGEYTAAAVLSFSFNKPHAVIDGNVYRVLSRIFGVDDYVDSTKGRSTFKKLAFTLLDKKDPALYNQAIMEFGAIQCKPKQPQCEDCCFSQKCYALNARKIDVLPRKEKKIKLRSRYFNYIVITNIKEVIINKRTTKDIWMGLYDFPLIETAVKIEDFGSLDYSTINYHNFNNYILSKSTDFKQQLSHQKIHATFWRLQTDNFNTNNESQIKIPVNKIVEFPVPKLIENYIKSFL